MGEKLNVPNSYRTYLIIFISVFYLSFVKRLFSCLICFNKPNFISLVVTFLYMRFPVKPLFPLFFFFFF